MPYAISRDAAVFTRRWDLLLFAVPVFLTSLVVGWDLLVGIHGADALIWFAVMVAIDKAHIWSTVFRSYLDKEVRQRHPLLLYLGPLLFVLLGVAIECTLGVKTLVRLFLYYQMYHVMRQQYGWIAQVARRARPRGSRIDLAWDKALVYAFVVVPFAWAHVSPQGSMGGLEFASRPLLAHALAALFAICLVGYIGLQATRLLIHHETVSISELLVAGTTAFVWGGMMVSGMLLGPSPYWLFVSLTYHAVPYIGAALWTAKDRQSESVVWRHRFAVPSFLFVLLLWGYFWQQVQDGLLHVPAQSVGALHITLTALAVAVPTMHYAIDGVIWKRGGGLQRLFRRDPPAAAERAPALRSATG
jgi:hypothetical protein